MNKHYLFLLLAFFGCAADEAPDGVDGPPAAGEQSLQAAGKADGGPSLGTATVQGEQSGYRSDPMYGDLCTAGGKVSFDVSYVNKSLPWGVKLSLWRGMAGEEWCGGCEPAYYGTFDWSDHQAIDMVSSGAWTWSAHTDSYGYGAGAGGRFTAMKYVVKITMPDGSVRWDNGGSNMGYYKVNVPDPTCETSWTPYETHDSAMQELPVTTIYQ